MSAKEKNAATEIWDFLCSLKLTIVTLILLAATSIIGTVIQQNRPPSDYVQLYGESMTKLFSMLGFFDMYHSWWFVMLLALFSVNLTACSIKRLPKVWETVRNPLLVADDTYFRSLANVEDLTVKKPLNEVRERVAAFLATKFGPAVVTEQDGKLHLYLEKCAWARFGVYITHLSILIVFLGAIIGVIWGYKGYVNIVEGTEVSQVWVRGQEQPVELGFAVRCDEFSVSYYPGGQRPKEFRSVLTVSEGGRVVVDKRPIIVNDPLTYKGITFYQSSYGPAGDATFNMTVRDRASGEVKSLRVAEGAWTPLTGGGAFRVVNFIDNDPRFGQAVQIEITTPSGSRSTANIFKDYPNFDERRGGEQIFSLVDFKQRFYTGLQVAKDPGVWVVWTGCFFMVVGSLVAFFVSHRRIWVTLTPQGERTQVRIGGSAHRNQPAFEIFFDDLKKDLKNTLNQ